jgi:hypothetical protein
VRYLGDYEHPEITTFSTRQQLEIGAAEELQDSCKTTQNILLEYGEFDLDKFFAEQLPPVLENEIKYFWMALFEVADAVNGIHNLTITTDGMTREYHGYDAVHTF